MLSLFNKLWKLATPKEKGGFAGLVFMMMIATFLELLGIGLIMPVIALLSQPELIQTNTHLKLLHDSVNPESDRQFIIILCSVLTVVFVVKNIFLIVMTSLQSSFTARFATRVTSRLYWNYLYVDYPFHLERNSSDLLNNIYLAVSSTRSILMPMMA